MKYWVKLYTEVLDDPDQGTLTWAERGIWSALLALAGKLDKRDDDDRETGQLDALERVAWHLRMAEGELTDAVAKFTEREMVDERDGVLFVTHYGDRQARAPSDAHAPVAERVQRHRKTKQCNEDVTTLQSECNEDVSRLREEKIREEKIRSIASCASASGGPDAHDANVTSSLHPRYKDGDTIRIYNHLTGKVEIVENPRRRTRQSAA